MRLLDYQRYAVETARRTGPGSRPPCATRPSSNRMERLYQRLAKPMTGLDEADRTVWRYCVIYPNTAIDLYPDQVNVWQIRPDGPEATDDHWACFREPNPGPVTRLVQRINQRFNTEVLDEDVDLVSAVQTGIRTRGYAPGPLSAREAGVGLVRRPHPRRRRLAERARMSAEQTRERILEAAAELISEEGIDEVRIARVANRARVSTSLVHHYFSTREELLTDALMLAFDQAAEERFGAEEPEIAKRSHTAALAVAIEQCLPELGPERARVGAVGGAVAAGGPRPRAAARSRRACTSATARLDGRS